VEDPVTDIDGVHPRCGSLQEAVGEAAGGRTHIGAGPSGNVEAESYQGGLELEPAAGNEPRRRGNFETRRIGDELGRPGSRLPVDAHFARQDQPLSDRPALGQALGYEGCVEAMPASATGSRFRRHHRPPISNA
jgi:hypothetical protein